MTKVKEKTSSEKCFEQFCRENDIECELLPLDGSSTPDYQVLLEDQVMMVEIKELTLNEKEEQAMRDLAEGKECILWDEGKIGNRIRYKIDESKEQLRRFASDKCPGILVLYDNRPFLIKGIAPYEILVAMYGFETIDLHVPERMEEPVRFGKHKFGTGRKLRRDSHNYISAIGILKEENRNGQLHLDLYNNIFAANPIPIKRLVGREDITVFTVAPGKGNEFRGWAKVVTDREE